MPQLKVKYLGINRMSPQSEAPDGSCQEIINARWRKGAWRPVGFKGSATDKSTILNRAGSPVTMNEVFLHDIENGLVPGEPNWIGLQINAAYDAVPATGDLYLINPDSSVTTILLGIDASTPIKVVFLKRTMIVTSNDGVMVFLFSTDKTYVQTASLPVPDVDLDIDAANSLQVSTDLVKLQDHKTLAESTIGNYFDLLNTQSKTLGRLFGSLMYISVYRLFDGSYILPSIPRYFQINNSGSIEFSNWDGPGDYSAVMTMIMSGLTATINNELYPSSIGDAKDLVESICVFATKVTNIHTIDSDVINEGFMIANIPGNSSGTVQVTKLFKNLFTLADDFTKLAMSEGWYKIHEFQFDEIVGKTGRTTINLDTKGYYQDYATRDTLPTDQFTHHKLVARVPLVYNDRLHLLNVKTAFGLPYVVWPDKNASYGSAESFPGTISVYLKTSLGQAVRNAEIDVPIYREVEELITEMIATQELADMRLYSLSTGLNFISGFVTEIHDIDGVLLGFKVIYKSATGALSYFILPEVIGYNDSRAYKIQITVNSGAGDKLLFSETLTKNTLMNFSFWTNKSFLADEDSLTANYKVTKQLTTTVNTIAIVPAELELTFDTNRLQVSEIQNPLVFPAKNSYQIGTGDGLAMAAGSEPLSTGQFGQFPLQVFTTKGGWSLEIGSGDVLYQNVLPFTSEVIDNPKNVIPVGGGVVYSTPKGLFMLQGRQSVELSEVVEGLPAITQYIPEIQTLITDDRHVPILSHSLSEIDFLTYLESSVIGYDHLNKELIVSGNKDYNYSYVFSFESKTWFKIFQTFNGFINNYPRLIGIGSANFININEESTDQAIEILIVTNALTLGMPDINKRIERLRQNITFSSLSGKSGGFYIFGSDDLVTWQFLTGKQKEGNYIKDLLTQRTQGSSKYFVFVFSGTIAPDSEIKDIDILFKEKWNNRLR